MVNLKNIVMTGAFLMTGLSANAQELNGSPYVRELHNFNTKSEHAVPKEIKYDKRDFIPNAFYDGEAQNSVKGNSLNIFYRTNEWKLTDMDKGDISKYFYSVINPLAEETKIKSMNVNGYADAVGSATYNSELSLRRAEEVAKRLRVSRPGAKIYVSSFGESIASGEENPNDRRVTIDLNENPYYDALDKMRAPVYNLDQSGSMWKNGAWELLQDFPFPDFAKVYSFSHPTDLTKKEAQHDFDLQNEIPYGKTSVYQSLDKLLDEYSNTTITSMVNGFDNVSKAMPYEIIKKAKERNVKLNFIGINLDKKTMNEYTAVSIKTGGKRYFITKL